MEIYIAKIFQYLFLLQIVRTCYEIIADIV